MIFRPINLNPDIPLSAFTRGKPIVPSEATVRVQRLGDYQSLYDGDFTPITSTDNLLNEVQPGMSQKIITINWFRRISDFFAELMMAYPPEVHEDIEEEFWNALHSAIIDQTRFGTAIMHAYVQDSVPKIERVDPRQYYRLVDGSQVALSRLYGDAQAVYYRMQRYYPDRVEQYTLNTTLSATINSIRSEGGGVLPAGVDQLLSVAPQRPAEGDFGRGIYVDMAPLVLELIRRITYNSDILDIHSNPLLIGWRKGGNLSYGMEREEAKTLREQITRVWRNWRKQSVLPLDSDQYDKVEYLTWDGALNGSFAQIQEIEQQLYTTTKAPAALQASMNSGVVPSGAALKRLFITTYAYVHSVQRALTPMLRRVLSNLAILSGRPEFAEPFVWPNPFDVIASDDAQGGEQGVSNDQDLLLSPQ